MWVHKKILDEWANMSPEEIEKFTKLMKSRLWAAQLVLCTEPHPVSDIFKQEFIMTDAQKLQKLIEIAQSNGWKSQLRMEAIDDPYEPTGCLQINMKHVGYFNIEYFLFDHEFIKALCKAKYGQSSDLFIVNQIFKVGEDGRVKTAECYKWESHLMQLAVSPNRIEYLWDIFGLPKPPEGE